VTTKSSGPPAAMACCYPLQLLPLSMAACVQARVWAGGGRGLEEHRVLEEQHQLLLLRPPTNAGNKGVAGARTKAPPHCTAFGLDACVVLCCCAGVVVLAWRDQMNISSLAHRAESILRSKSTPLLVCLFLQYFVFYRTRTLRCLPKFPYKKTHCYKEPGFCVMQAQTPPNLNEAGG